VTRVDPVAVTFDINDVTSIDATVVAAALAGDRIVLTIELAPEEWERADLLMLFHLDWDVRNPGTVSGSVPVEVEIRLAALDDSPPSDPTAIVDLLAEAPPGAALRAETNWYALEVTEPVDLPPDLAALGQARTGFTTTW